MSRTGSCCSCTGLSARIPKALKVRARQVPSRHAETLFIAKKKETYPYGGSGSRSSAAMIGAYIPEAAIYDPQSPKE